MGLLSLVTGEGRCEVDKCLVVAIHSSSGKSAPLPGDACLPDFCLSESAPEWQNWQTPRTQIFGGDGGTRTL